MNDTHEANGTVDGFRHARGNALLDFQDVARSSEVLRDAPKRPRKPAAPKEKRTAVFMRRDGAEVWRSSYLTKTVATKVPDARPLPMPSVPRADAGMRAVRAAWLGVESTDETRKGTAKPSHFRRFKESKPLTPRVRVVNVGQ
jgi:hypothetical protein